jgi:hypothetical protein
MLLGRPQLQSSRIEAGRAADQFWNCSPEISDSARAESQVMANRAGPTCDWFFGTALAVALYSSSISLSAPYPGGRSVRAGSGGVSAGSCRATA